MGEIDTKSIDSVQVALTHFGERFDHQKKVWSGGRSFEIRDGLLRDLANYKLQLEAKECGYQQLLIRLEHYQATIEDLRNQVRKTEAERDAYKEEAREARTRIESLELKVKEMADDQVLETKRQLDTMNELESQLVARSVSLHYKTQQSSVVMNKEDVIKELIRSSEKAVSDVANDLSELKTELEAKEREDSSKTIYIEALESEVSRLKLQVSEANIIVNSSNCEVQMITGELENANFEMLELEARENDAQVEVALLKAELHECRSKLAAAEAAGSRAESLRWGLNLAVEQLAIEAEEAKQENIRLKRGGEKGVEESDKLALVVNDSNDGIEEPKFDAQSNITMSLEHYVTLIARAENAEQSAAMYSNQLTRTDSATDSERLRKDLEAAMVKVGEFRTRAEQASTRAEAAERAKVELTDRLDQWTDRKQKRKAALAALRENALTSYPPTPSYDTGPKYHQPLFKVLNMKF